jgi:hypothetical protein
MPAFVIRLWLDREFWIQSFFLLQYFQDFVPLSDSHCVYKRFHGILWNISAGHYLILSIRLWVVGLGKEDHKCRFHHAMLSVYCQHDFLVIHLGAYHVLSRHSTTWDTPRALFCFTHFSDRILHFCLRPASDCDPLTCGLPCSCDHRHVPPHPACLLRWCLPSFPLAWLWPRPSKSLSRVAGITSVYHHTWSSVHLFT